MRRPAFGGAAHSCLLRRRRSPSAAPVEELRLALLEFRDLYNRSWILQKHGYLTPSQVRAKLTGGREVAA